MRFYKPFLLNLSARNFWQKRTTIHSHGEGPPEVQGPTQPHRLHQLKAGPE